jgi:hypothetical protein
VNRKAWILLVGIGLAGCSTHYDIAGPSETFVAEWNQSVPGEALQIKQEEANRYASKGGDFSVWYRDGEWSLITTVGAEGNLVCTELLIRATGMSFDRAQGLVERTATEDSVRDGNLRFYMNRMGGGVSCSVDVAKPAS